jgi:hypothetical protein
MNITIRQLKKIIKEVTMYQLWAQHNREAVQAADEVIRNLGLTPENALRKYPGGVIENEIHVYLEEEIGLPSTSDEIFQYGDEALEVVALMLGLPKDTF